MKFRATMTMEYEVSKAHLREEYGTDDPKEAAKIDAESFNDDPGLFMSTGEHFDVKVEAVDE